MEDKKFLALGFNTKLIEKIHSKNLSFTALRGVNYKALLNIGFSEQDAILIRERVNRKPIPVDVIDIILSQTGGVCCYCANGNHTQPYQIHHIYDYASSQNHNVANLMLVCPTHHVYIHQNKIKAEKQLEAKHAWISLWEISSQYASKSLSFPFGAFEYIDYGTSGSVTDIFSFGTAKPRTSALLADGPLLQSAFKILEENDKILLSGDSGSGKTTLSLAIASKIDSAKVYRYCVGEKGSAETMQEIILFLSLAIKPIVLIIDDVNPKLIPGHIEKIMSFGQKDKKLIVVNTKQGLSSTNNLEQRLAALELPVTWSALRSTVMASMQQHEHEIVGYLKSKGLDTYNGRKIGYSFTETKFSEVLDSYATGTNTVWQFIYMLGSGRELLQRRLSELYHRDRLDLLVSFLGINHVATGEQGATIEDMNAFYQSHPYFTNQSQPSSDWIKDQLEQLSALGLIKRNRDRYNLAHRMLAINFLELSYLSDQENTEELLDMFFVADKPARQVLILWSWLRDTFVRRYISQWMSSRSLKQWDDLTHEVLNEGLLWLNAMTVMLAGANEVLDHIFKDKGEAVAEVINKQGEGTLNDFIQLSTPFKNHAPEIWPALLKGIDQKKFYHLLLHAKPWELYSLDKLFCTIWELGYSSWSISFTKKFSKPDFSYMAQRINNGDVQAFSGLIQFWRRFVTDISVGEFVQYIAFIPEILKGAKIKDLRFDTYHSGYSEILGFPELVNKIMEVLDPEEMAREFVALTPDQWANVLTLSHLSEFGGHSAISDFVAGIDLNELCQNIQHYYQDYPFGFRLIIYQLAYDKERRKEISKLLQPLIELSVQRSISMGYIDHEGILEAFARIDAAWVEDYCGRSNISLQSPSKAMYEVDKCDIKLNAFYLKDLDLNGLMPSNKISLDKPST